MSKKLLFVLLVSMLLLVTASVSADSGVQSMRVVDFDGAVQYLDASVINTGTVHMMARSQSNPGKVSAVAPNGVIYHATPNWLETNPGQWKGSMYMPSGWGKLWLTNDSSLRWEGYGPWQPASDTVGVELTEARTYPTFDVQVSANTMLNGNSQVRYTIDIQPGWLAQDVVYYGAFTGLEIETSCETLGNQNAGSFVWDFIPGQVLQVSNTVSAPHVANPSFEAGNYNLLRWDGTTLLTGQTTVPNCNTD